MEHQGGEQFRLAFLGLGVARPAEHPSDQLARQARQQGFGGRPGEHVRAAAVAAQQVPDLVQHDVPLVQGGGVAGVADVVRPVGAHEQPAGPGRGGPGQRQEFHRPSEPGRQVGREGVRVEGLPDGQGGRDAATSPPELPLLSATDRALPANNHALPPRPPDPPSGPLLIARS